jgi:hypothetical protein
VRFLVVRHLEMLSMFEALKDLRFYMETGKLWEPPHPSSGDTSTV